MITTIGRSKLCAWLSVLVLVTPLPAVAQPSGSAAPPGAPPPPPGSSAAFTAEQLEQVAAPIALYPDPLLAQVMMASTYPLEIVQAARFLKDNPNLKEDQLNEKLKDQTWDDSVKSLVAFPQVLELMNNKLDWTQKLGDAFLAQQKELLEAVQRLRARAQAEGNLKSTPQQTVTVEPVAAAAAPAQPAQPPPGAAPPQTVVVQQLPAQVIKIEPTNPEVVYVPSYNPTVVYGAWPYPAAPPYYPYPPGYAFGAAALSFGVGMAVGAAVWGNCNWGGGNVEINNSNYQNYSKNVNRSNVASERTARAQQGQAGNRSQWQHNPENRKGVQYRDQGTQQRYNRGGNPQATQSREAFRGRAEQGRQDLSRGGAGGFGGGSGGRGQTPGGGQGGGRAQNLGGGQGSRGGREAGAFQGMGSGGDARSFSDRGQASRQSSFGAGGGGGGRSVSGAGGGGGGRSVSGGGGGGGGRPSGGGGGGGRGGGGGGRGGGGGGRR